jgi:hypothetical protein
MLVFVLGPIGWLLPVLPGTLFFVTGLVLISKRHFWAARVLGFVSQRIPGVRAVLRKRTGGASIRNGCRSGGTKMNKQQEEHFGSAAAATAGAFRSRALPVTLCVAVVIGLAVFATGFAIDRLLSQEPRSLLYSDAFTGIVAALLAYIALKHYVAVQEATAARLRAVGEINHHIRNALEVVVLSVAVRRDAELIEITESAARRVDWVLKSVLAENRSSPTQ